MIQKPLLAHKFEENYRFMNKDWIATMGPLYKKKDIQINIERGSDYLISMATGSGKSNIWLDFLHSVMIRTSPSIENAYMPFDNTPVIIEAFNMNILCSCRTSCF
ncbi:hypothetical protein DVH24_001669 [Malus domestica]|uniref:Uncharacterized protein n=1 Tax=Malus domestica TaxID=3750 RepID=A0A498I9D5_MALDO|nr:hypothetical protein DVH24_001669 [Malus domestica]